ncbi:MAG TPA: CHAD domain-containing protein, partial [Candidatus Binatia bacterium]|nr:CHAD domain-containing protein [Candidatus Binatia bacterium]
MSLCAAMDAPETANAAQRKLLKLAHKRLERFVTLAPKFLVNDDPETIHDLRVSSRRLQQTIRSLSASPQPARSRKLVKVLRRVRQALGSLRNLDVNSELARSRMKKAPSPVLRDSWQALADHLQKQRHALVGAARAEVAKYDGIQFIERAQKLLSHADLETDPIPALEKAVAESLSEWDENYALAMENRSVDHLHSLRIATKRLRYRAELLADIGAASLKPRVRDLKNIQSALGDWHDRSV